MENKTALNQRASMTSKISKSLNQFFTWWISELLGVLGPAMRERVQGRRNYLILEKQEQEFRARYGYRGNLRSIGQFSLDGDNPDQSALPDITRVTDKVDEIVLFLSKDELLEKTISFPAATEPNLRNVVGYEMDRYTPFSADQVYFGCRITGRDPSNQRITVSITLIPRKKLDPTLEALNAIGIKIGAVAPAEYASESLYAFNLLPESEQSIRLKRKRLRQRWQWAFLLLAIVGAVIAFTFSQNQRLQNLQEMVVEPKAMAETARQVKAELALLNDSRTFLITKKNDELSVLIVLNELTQMLPDHTWISRMEWQQERVLKLTGESAEASALISLLEDSEYLQDVRFASPVTTNPRTQKERFVILVQLRKEAT